MFSFQPHTNDGTVPADRHTFVNICRSVLHRLRNVSNIVLQKIKTQFTFTFLFYENRVCVEKCRVCFGVVWKNVVYVVG